MGKERNQHVLNTEDSQGKAPIICTLWISKTKPKFRQQNVSLGENKAKIQRLFPGLFVYLLYIKTHIVLCHKTNYNIVIIFSELLEK